MTINEFIEMLNAIEEEKPFSIGIQLEWSETHDLTLTGLTERISAGVLALFFSKVASAEPPDYKEVEHGN